MILIAFWLEMLLCLIAAAVLTFRSQPFGSSSSADLSVSAMSDADDSVSMVGANPRRRHAIDQYAWGRAALHFAGISLADHEALARKLGHWRCSGSAAACDYEAVRQQHAPMGAGQGFGHSLEKEALDPLDD